MHRQLLSMNGSVFTGDSVGANSLTHKHATLDDSEMKARNHEAAQTVHDVLYRATEISGIVATITTSGHNAYHDISILSMMCGNR